MNHFPLSSLVSLQPEDDSWNIFSPRPQRINVIPLLENAINKFSSEMDFQPVTLLHSPLLPTLKDPSFDIFLQNDLDKTYNEIGKTTTETTMMTSMTSPGLTFWENPSDIKFNENIKSNKGDYVMNIKWDYNYYQPWSDNEWLVDEMLAMLDKDIIMQ